MTAPVQPPSLGLAALEALLPADLASAVIGDLLEEFHTTALAERGPRKARAWLNRQALRSLLPLLAMQIEPRATAVAALSALVAGGATLRLLGDAWAYILWLVPFRAAYAPPPSFLAAALAVSASAVVAAFIAGRAVARLLVEPERRSDT